MLFLSIPLLRIWSPPAFLTPAARLHARPSLASDAGAARDPRWRSGSSSGSGSGSSLFPQTRSVRLLQRLQPSLQQPLAGVTLQQQQQAVGVLALPWGGPSSTAVVRQPQRRLLASAPNPTETNPRRNSRTSGSSNGKSEGRDGNAPQDHMKDTGPAPNTSSSSSSSSNSSSNGSSSSSGSSRSVRASFVALMNSPQWIGMKRQQKRLQRLWLRELRKQQEQQSVMRSLGRWPGALQTHVLGLLQRFREALTFANRKQLQQQVKRKRLVLQGQSARLKEQQQILVSRLRQELRLQQQQLRRQLQQQQSVMQEKRLIWAERRRRKLAAALLLMQEQRAHLTAATAGAKEKLKALWRRYGWTAVASYGIVHALTLLSLFGVAFAVPLATLKKMAASVGLGRLLESEKSNSDRHKVWGAAFFAYIASKPLIPLQVALAIWLTPSLARFFGGRIDRLGGRAEAAASSAAGDAAAAAAAAAAKAATAAARSWQAAKVRRESWRKNKNNSKGPPPPASSS
ncbi:hypothetical protein Esti_005928 [Eimeria stiedai]